MRLATIIAALGLASSTMAKISLLNPPEFGSNVNNEHETWVERQEMNIVWTAPEPNRLFSVVLYQMNSTMLNKYSGQFPADDPPFEFITHDQVNKTYFRWTVATTKNLTISDQFAIAVWVDGMQMTDSATDTFYIRPHPGVPTATITGKRVPSPTPPPSPSASGFPVPETAPSTSGLSGGASAGIGIGAGLGVMALAAAIWFLVRRRRQRAIPVHVGGSPQSAGSDSPMTPEKMGYFQYPPTTQTVYPGELGLSPVRAEMPPESRDRYELATEK